MTTPTYESILADVRGDGPLRTGVITLNRPKQLNALNDALMDELGDALKAFDANCAKFGQLEIKLGVTPGAGGTQLLPRAVGKAKAMDMVLTSRMMDALEAERSGLVSRVVPADKLMDEALATASVIRSLSLPSVTLAKQAVNHVFEAPLAEGIRFKRLIFQSLFGTADQREGMTAFLDKCKPAFVRC